MSDSAVEDLFHLRSTEFAFHRQRLQFDLARSVFASGGIDPGSALLLRHLQTVPLDHIRRVLDVGCGVGVLGIVLCALGDQRRLVAVDRDALACAYTRRNLALNDLPLEGHHQVLGSLGYDEVGGMEPFDLIVSNIPGKAGETVIRQLVTGAAAVAAPKAIVGFVVVTPLVELVAEAVEVAGFETLVAKGNKAHQVVVARLGPDQTAEAGATPLRRFDDGLYDRQTSSFSHRSMTWDATTVAGLPEFDNLAHPTTMLRGALQGVDGGPSVLVNPGQGHRAAIAAKVGYPPARLVGRDLLALRAAHRCLEVNGFPTPELVHDISVGPALDAETNLVILHADDKVYAPYLTDQVTRVLDHLAALPRTHRRDLVLTGRASILGRLEADLLRRRPGRVAHKASQRGFRALRFRLPGGSGHGPQGGASG